MFTAVLAWGMSDYREIMTTRGQEQHIGLQRNVTGALLKFCEDHNYPSLGLTEIRECLKALERRAPKTAVEYYRKVPLGGRMGYFDEWVVPVVFHHETPEYVHFVFAALVAQWRSVMDHSLQVDD
jgi:hypothetical protein